MSNLKRKEKKISWEKDLEWILTEWEGKSNPLVGAIRVTSRMKTLKQFISSLLDQQRKEIVGEIIYEFNKLPDFAEIPVKTIIYNIRHLMKHPNKNHV